MKLLSIITVDDEPHIHEGLDTIMDWTSLGCVHTLAAANGSEALKLISIHRPDIILTDIKMPILDGISLIQKVREMEGYDPAVIVMSGYNDFAYAQAALRHKASDYLLKPIDEDELAACLKGILENSRKAKPEEPDPEEMKAALSTVFRRLSMHGQGGSSADTRILLKDPRVVPPFAFGLLVPFSRIDAEGQPVYGGFLPEKVYPALLPLKDRNPVECLYRESFGSVGLLFAGGVVGTSGPTLEAEIRGVHRIIAPALGCGAKLIVGTPVAALEDIFRSRKSVLEYMGASYVMHAPGVVLVSRESQTGCVPVKREQVSLLMKEVDEGDGPKALVHLNEIFTQLKNGSLSANALRDWMNILSYEVRRLLERLDGGPVPHEDLFRAVVKNVEFMPFAELTHCVSSFIESVCERVKSLRASVRHSSVVLIQRAVERRCAAEVTLAELAEELHMNPVYLGQLFKQVIGKSFKDYQREIRVKEACRLLKETNERITDIAVLVGYQNYDYFVEQFKREMKTTPSAYRRS
ncbi:MAG: response regulator [Spirochaetales bacterium]|nr:response regulator [Spirochaetales bacterium]